MSWFWRSAPAKPEETSGESDPYAGLDPGLREFARGGGGAAAKPSAGSVGVGADGGAGGETADLALAALQYKRQKGKVSAAAVFNCSDAEADLAECFTRGAWWDKASLCEEQKNAFWKCVDTNKNTLYELGYGVDGNTADQDEELRGRADDMYVKRQERDTPV